MSASTHAASPFDMLINPQAILDAMQNSARLQSLDRKICRPLDRLSPAKPGPGPEAPVLGTTSESGDDPEFS
jgi:hypothetical protein